MKTHGGYQKTEVEAIDEKPPERFMDSEYEFHPACLAFHPYDLAAFVERRNDYKLNPQRAKESVVLLAQHRGTWKIADGRHHYLICKDLGYETQFEKFGGDLAALISLVKARNAFRRHDKPGARAAAIQELDELLSKEAAPSEAPSTAPESAKPAEPPAKKRTVNQKAQDAGVSRSTMLRTTKVAKKAPELMQAVQTGALDPKTAAAVASLPQEVREKVSRATDVKAAAKAALEQPNEFSLTEQEEDPENPPLDPAFMPNAAESEVLATHFRNWVARLRAVRTEIRKPFPDSDHVVLNRIGGSAFDAQLAELVETLDKNVPEHVCPVCVGTGEIEGEDAGCKFCDRYGVVDKHHHAGLKAKWKHTRKRYLSLKEGGK